MLTCPLACLAVPCHNDAILADAALYVLKRAQSSVAAGQPRHSTRVLWAAFGSLLAGTLPLGASDGGLQCRTAQQPIVVHAAGWSYKLLGVVHLQAQQ